MSKPLPQTVREQIAWAYANLARCHRALEEGRTKYNRTDHIVRNKLYHGLTSGEIAMRSFYDDERLKMLGGQHCCYCGKAGRMSIDHLIPRIAGGGDFVENLVWACQTCNSSKGGRDLLLWAQGTGTFPPLLLLRRYLKIVCQHCEACGIMDLNLAEERALQLPFDLRSLPTSFPPLEQLRLVATEQAPLETSG
jgi:hypothetical protein